MRLRVARKVIKRILDRKYKAETVRRAATRLGANRLCVLFLISVAKRWSMEKIRSVLFS